jgi:PAS domain S-box-containing protein
MDQSFTILPVLVFIALAISILLLYRALKQRNMNRRSVGLYNALIDQSKDPVFIINPGGKIIFVNEPFSAWIGCRRSELIGRSIYLFTEYLHNEAIDEAMRGGHQWAGTVTRKLKDGSTRTAYLLLHPIKDDAGVPGEYAGIHLDITEHTLSSDDTRYEELLRNLPDGVVVLQRERIVFANPTAVKILGYESENELTDVLFTSFVASQSRSFAGEIYEKGMAGEVPIAGNDIKFLTKTNETVDLEVNSMHLRWNREPAVLLSLRDVADRKKAEREQAQWLWEQELLNSVERQLLSTVDLPKVLDMIVHHARLLVRADIAAVLTIDPEKGSYRWLAMKGNSGPYPTAFLPLSQAAKEFYHESEPRIIQDLTSPSLRAHIDFPLFHEERIATVVQYPLMRGSIVFGHLTLGYRKHYELAERLLKLIQSFNERATVAILNAELYDQLRQRTKTLQQLYETRMQAQEEERRRIAAELHDSLGQLLSSIRLHIEILQDTENADIQSDEEHMKEIRSLLDNAITEARNISYDLRPSILDDFGLIPALEVLCEKFSARTGMNVSFHSHNLEARLKIQLETALYRIAQEALNNVQKHAAATQVNVQIIRTPTTVNLVIEDDGTGFDPRRVGDPHCVGIDEQAVAGMGLVSMRERTAYFNGTFTVDSTPGKGTDIIVEIPLSGEVVHGKEDTDSLSR